MTYDAIVIGSGPGGSVTAHQLAGAGRHTVVMEEGPWAPLDTHEPFSMDEMTHLYRNQGMGVAWGPPHINVAEGRCVGGGSEINSGLYHRLPEPIRASWETRYHIKHFGTSDLTPHAEAIEQMLSIHSPDTPHSAAALKLKHAADALGWSCQDVPRWVKQGVRQTMTETYLKHYLNEGGRIISQTRVHRIRRTATGWDVVWRGPNGRGTMQARSVFVAGGAIQTPLLLRRSGITQQVGQTVGLHPTIKVIAEYDHPVSQMGDGVGRFQVDAFAPGMRFGSSVGTPLHLAQGLVGYGLPAQWDTQWNRFAVYYGMISTATTGSVRSLWQDDTPIIRYRLTPADRIQLGEAFERLCELLWASGATRLYPSVPNIAPLTRREEGHVVRRMIEKGNGHFMSIHLFGSCPMGEHPDRCAVDSFGQVHGHPGLYVADASLLGGSPSVNPQGSVMAITRRNVTHFLQQRNAS